LEQAGRRLPQIVQNHSPVISEPALPAQARSNQNQLEGCIDIFFTEEFVEMPMHEADSSVNMLYIQMLATKSTTEIHLFPQVLVYPQSQKDSDTVTEDAEESTGALNLGKDVVFVLDTQFLARQLFAIVRLCCKTRKIYFYCQSSYVRLLSGFSPTVMAACKLILPAESPEWSSPQLDKALCFKNGWHELLWEIITPSSLSLSEPDRHLRRMKHLLLHVQGLMQGSNREGDDVNVTQVDEALKYTDNCNKDRSDRLKCKKCKALLCLSPEFNCWWFLDCNCRQRRHSECDDQTDTAASGKCSLCGTMAEHIFVGSGHLLCRCFKIPFDARMCLSEVVKEPLDPCSGSAARQTLAARSRQYASVTLQDTGLFQQAVVGKRLEAKAVQATTEPLNSTDKDQSETEMLKPPSSNDTRQMQEDPSKQKPTSGIDIDTLENKSLKEELAKANQRITILEESVSLIKQKLSQLGGKMGQPTQNPSTTADKTPTEGDYTMFLRSMVKWRQSQGDASERKEIVSKFVAQVKVHLTEGGDFVACAKGMGEVESRAQYHGGKNKQNKTLEYYKDKVEAQLNKPQVFLMKTRNKCESEPYIVLIGLLLIDLFDAASATNVEKFIDKIPEVSLKHTIIVSLLPQKTDTDTKIVLCGTKTYGNNCIFPRSVTEVAVLKRLLSCMLLAPVYNLGTSIFGSGKLQLLPPEKLPEAELLTCLGKTLAMEFAKILLTAKLTRLESSPRTALLDDISAAKILLTAKLTRLESSPKIPFLDDVSASVVSNSQGTPIDFSHNPAHSAIVIHLMREDTIQQVDLDIQNRSLMFCFGADCGGYDGRCSLPDLVNFLHGQGTLDTLSGKQRLVVEKTVKDMTSILCKEDGTFAYDK